MAEILKERSELDPDFQWDLSSDESIGKAASYQGKLTDARTIREFMDADTQLDRLLSDLFCYANLRRSEDTRGETAQSMYARIYGKYVAAVSQTAFAVPEILSLPEEKLEEIAREDCLIPYRFQMDKLIRRKAHTLSAAEEQLLVSLIRHWTARDRSTKSPVPTISCCRLPRTGPCGKTHSRACIRDTALISTPLPHPTPAA